MIISRTPYRISFFGGGTDYPEWYSRYGGSVLATSINKYCYISCRYLPPFFEHKSRIVYANTESVQSVDEIAHPAVREILRYLKVYRGVEIHHDGDLPARSGIASSSEFTVGLLHALHALQGHLVSKEALAREAIYIEQNVLKETVGSQDQVSTAYGGFNHVEFTSAGEIRVRPVTIHGEYLRELNSHLQLFYTGLSRTASEIAQSYFDSRNSNHQRLWALNGMVTEAMSILANGEDVEEFGRLMHEAWMAKRGLSDAVSNSLVDEVYDEARSAGALGGKLIGAGGGGFMLLFVRPADQAQVRDRLKRLVHVPFRFDSTGSQIVFFDPEEDYASLETAAETAAACA
ncbi:MAG: GHMP family kinase ATP-binding protein [Chloroflexota bacterium]